MHIISTLFAKIFRILIVVTFVVVVFFALLCNGIKIDEISFKNIKISHFFIKLDEKLRLNIGEVYIKTANKTEFNSEEIKRQILAAQHYKRILLHFSQIKLAKLIVNENEFSLNYDDFVLKLNSNDLNASVNINFVSNDLKAKINEINYQNFVFHGDLEIKDSVNLSGILSDKDDNFSLEFDFSNQARISKIHIKKAKINNQINTMNYLQAHLKPVLKTWLIDRVKYENFEGEFSFLIENNKLKKASGSGEFSKVAATYNDKAPTAYTDKMQLSLKDFSLRLDAKNLSSENDVRADSFLLTIDNFFKANTYIKIVANKAVYGAGIEKIINAYGVFLGLKQLSGTSNANIEINLFHNHKHDVIVNVDTAGKYDFHGLKFDAAARVGVKNHLVNISGNASLDNMLKASGINMNLNAKTKLASIFAKNLEINFDDNFYYKNPAHLALNLAKKELFFKEANAKILLDKNIQITAKINDIKKYSKRLSDFKFANGDIKINHQNKLTKITLANTNFDLGLYKNSDFHSQEELKNYLANELNRYNFDTFYIKADEKGVKIDSLSKKISLQIDKDYHIYNLDNLLISLDKSSESEAKNVEIKLKNSKIFYKDFLFDFATLSLKNHRQTSKIEANFSKGGKMFAIFKKDNFKAYLRNVNALTLNQILFKTALLDGMLDLDARGKSLDDFTGLINIRNAHIPNTKNYASLISLLETIPSLVRLKLPEAKRGGLGIVFGSIEFSKIKDLIQISSINIKGYNIDTTGKGYIDLAKNEANIGLNIFTLKNTNAIISSIPIVKELIIGGKDSKIATQIKITGKLDDLQFKSQLLKEILKSPFGLIKNIVNLPKNLIN